MAEIEVPCSTCAGTGDSTCEDRHAGTNMDTCRTCGGRRTIPARPGESRATSWPGAAPGDGWLVCRCDAGDDPRPDVEWTGDPHDEAHHGPAIACADDTGEPLFLVWWDYFGNGVSKITHWRPLPSEFAPPKTSIVRAHRED